MIIYEVSEPVFPITVCFYVQATLERCVIERK